MKWLRDYIRYWLSPAGPAGCGTYLVLLALYFTALGLLSGGLPLVVNWWGQFISQFWGLFVVVIPVLAVCSYLAIWLENRWRDRRERRENRDKR